MIEDQFGDDISWPGCAMFHQVLQAVNVTTVPGTDGGFVRGA